MSSGDCGVAETTSQMVHQMSDKQPAGGGGEGSPAESADAAALRNFEDIKVSVVGPMQQCP